MRAGRLDRLIDLQKEVVTEHPTTNEEIISYQVYDTNVPAEKVERSGNEAYLQNVRTPLQTVFFKIRYRDDIKLADQVLYEANTYRIIFIKELDRREGLELTTEVVT